MEISSQDIRTNQLQVSKANQQGRNKNKLDTVGEQPENQGGVTATPTRPNTDSNNNPEKTEDIQVKTNRRKKILIGGIGAIIVVILIITFSVLLSVYLAKSKSQRTEIRTRYTTSVPMANNQKMTLASVGLTNIEQLGEGKQLQLFFTEVQEKEQVKDGNGRLLQQTTAKQSNIEIHDPFTDITVSISSDNLQAEVGVSLNSIISYVLSNQPDAYDTDLPSDTNLQSDGSVPPLEDITPTADTTTPKVDRAYTYYNINQKLQASIKEELQNTGSTEVKTDLKKSFDAKLDTEGKSFEFVTQGELMSIYADDNFDTTTPLLAAPEQTLVINDWFNQTEIANAAAKVVVAVVRKIKRVIQKHREEIEQKTGFDLKATDPSSGETSIYLDQPSDVLKGCNRLSDDSIRCSQNLWDSGLLEVNQNPAVVGVPQLSVKLAL